MFAYYICAFLCEIFCISDLLTVGQYLSLRPKSQRFSLRPNEYAKHEVTLNVGLRPKYHTKPLQLSLKHCKQNKYIITVVLALGGIITATD